MLNSFNSKLPFIVGANLITSLIAGCANNHSLEQANMQGVKDFSAKSATVLTLTEKEIVDLIKTTSTEVDSSLPEEQRVLMSRAVVDTILNRKACGCFGATTVTEVVNQPWQFSAINSNLPYAYGSVDKMPTSAIKSRVRKDVESWLLARASGAPAQERGLNFLNPFYSSRTSMANWGSELVREAESSGHVYGDLNRRSVHYHGTAVGYRGKEPKPYGIILPKGWQPVSR